MTERPRLNVDPETTTMLEALRYYLGQRGAHAYLVGGFVRDSLLGRPSKDIDLAVTEDAVALADDMARFFGGTLVVLDETHQNARVIMDKVGGRWQIDFSGMLGATIEEDLRRRDFNVNAIAVELGPVGGGWSHQDLIDPLGGLDDLEKGTIRAVSESTFRDDPARLLRAVRFAAVLGFAIDSGTETLIRRDHELLSNVAGERLRDEIRAIFECPKTSSFLRYLDRVKLLSVLAPELDVTRGVSQPKEHYWDVFNHCVEAVAAIERILEVRDRTDDEVVIAVPWSAETVAHFAQEVNGGWSRKALLKLAALFHDIGKPATRTIEESGRMRFLGHSQEGVRLVGGIMERLRFSNREIKVVQLMIEHHLRPANLANMDMPSSRAVYRYFRDTSDAGVETLFLSLADHLAARGPALDLANWRLHCQATGYLLHKFFHDRKAVAPPKLIDGHTIMERFGLPPGPRIGALLEGLREAQAAGEVSTTEEALKFIAKRLEKD